MKKIILVFALSVCILCIQSCGNDSEIDSEISKLKLENSKLKNEVDSLINLFEQEKLESIVINQSSGHKIKEGDSVEFIVGIVYDRPNLINEFSAQLFYNEDSLSSAILNEEPLYLSNPHNYYDENSSGITSFTVSNLKKGVNYFGGYVSVSRNVKTRTIPFKYTFMVE